MAGPFIVVPQFPNVPVAPGVPPVPRSAVNSIVDSLPPLLGDAISTLFGLDTSQWGIFDQDGNSVGDPDSVVAIEFAKERRISDFPVEDGGFQSFNKVALPFNPRVTLSRGGSDADRAAFLNAIDEACESLDLYTVVTPEITYPSVNLVRYDYRRTSSNGVTLLQVDVWLEEVRVSATATFSNTQQPAGKDAVNGGSVQPQTPTPAQSAAAAGGAT